MFRWVKACIMFRTLIFFIVLVIALVDSISKVIVPSVFQEWNESQPLWASESMQKKFGYSVFLYQKLNSSAPNYIKTNRGTEGGVYLRYIVDHYNDFPDVAFFVHAAPEVHQLDYNWLDMVNCVKPEATYISINSILLKRSSIDWHRHRIHIEQCWRDVLQIVWGYGRSLNDRSAFLNRVPRSRPIEVVAPCCQQFLMSRSMVRARPLEVWRKLHQIIAVDDVCHKGEPQYNSLFAYSEHFKKVPNEDANTSNNHSVPGGYIQGGTMEALAHVIFGQRPLKSAMPTAQEYCKQFISESECPGSPCRGKAGKRRNNSTSNTPRIKTVYRREKIPRNSSGVDRKVETKREEGVNAVDGEKSKREKLLHLKLDTENRLKRQRIANGNRNSNS